MKLFERISLLETRRDFAGQLKSSSYGMRPKRPYPSFDLRIFNLQFIFYAQLERIHDVLSKAARHFLAYPLLGFSHVVKLAIHWSLVFRIDFIVRKFFH